MRALLPRPSRSLVPLALLALVPAAARATDVPPAVRASIHDAPVNGTGDSFNAAPFEGLLRRGGTTQEDRAIQEFDLTAFSAQPVLSATLSGTITSNNSFDVGTRTFDFLLYAGNGTADLADNQVAATVVGTASYHPPITTSFTYSFDVTAAVQTLFTNGATWVGLRVQCTTDPNYPNILDDATSKIAIDVAATAGTGFCFGDGSATACPCGNASLPGAGQGCLSSLGVGGVLSGTGLASLSSDGVVLSGSNMPNSSALYFQGTGTVNAGLGATFGDGLRCAGGTVVRLGTKANAAGSSQYPGPGDQPVSVRGLIAAPGTFAYQVWYRNAAAFCTPSTFNLTNGLSVSWGV